MTFATFQRGHRPDTPGPAAYSIPSSLGQGPKYTLKGRIKQKDPDPEPSIYKHPSTLSKKSSTFGHRAPEPKKEKNPGPSYVPPPIGSDARKSTFRIKHYEPLNTNPSPADYTISRDLTKMPQSIGEGPRIDEINYNIIVSPDRYTLPSDFNGNGKITLGPSIPLPEPERNGPGPAKYIAETTIGKDTPLYSISHFHERNIEATPGPADYQRIRPLPSESKLACKFKWRTKLPQPDKCDYPYHAYPGTITPRKISHGIRPETSYDNHLPGPGSYNYLKPAIEQRPAAILSRHPEKDLRADFPSPADYFKTPITPQPQPSNFLGPSSRCPINIDQETYSPGPGYYEERGQFERPRTGYYFTSRMMEDFVPDTAGPYYAAKSTLGGPKYTIGKKEYWDTA